MKWVVALALIVGGVVGCTARSPGRPDLACPGHVSTAFREASYGLRTPRDALGKDLDGVDRVTEERGGSPDLPTVTYRGYDEDGDLVRLVVVEGGDRGWVAARVDTCD